MNFTFNEEQAKAGSQGGGGGNFDSQVARAVITDATWKTANSGAGMLELCFRTEAGADINYVNICHTKKDGTQNEVGVGHIQALMGVTGARNLTNGNNKCPELIGKSGMFAFQRRNYRKGDGSEGFGFEIKAYMSAKSGQTYAEHCAGKPAEQKEYWEGEFAKNPKGNVLEAQQGGYGGQQGGGFGGQQQGGVDAGAPQGGHDFDDSIPF